MQNTRLTRQVLIHCNALLSLAIFQDSFSKIFRVVSIFLCTITSFKHQTFGFAFPLQERVMPVNAQWFYSPPLPTPQILHKRQSSEYNTSYIIGHTLAHPAVYRYIGNSKHLGHRARHYFLGHADIVADSINFRFPFGLPVPYTGQKYRKRRRRVHR